MAGSSPKLRDDDARLRGDRARPDIDGLRAWIRLGAATLFATLGGAGMWAIVVVLPALQDEFALNRGAASLSYTSTMVGFALGNVVVGRLIDRLGFVRPAFVAVLLLSAGFALAAVAPSFVVVTLAQALLIGLGASVSFGPLIADTSLWFERHRGLAITLVASGNYVAGALWPIAIRWALAYAGWRWTYLGIALVCFVGMNLLLVALRGRPRPVGAERGAETTVAEATTFEGSRIDMPLAVLLGLLCLAGIGCCVAMSTPQVHLVAYSSDLGYGVANGANMLSVMLGAGIISRVLSGYVADRIGGVRTLLIGSLLQGLSLMLFIPLTGLPALYAVSLIFGLAQGGIVPCYAIIVRENMPAAQAGRGVGIVIMATIGGMALGGWLSGFIHDQTGSYAAAFANGVAWNLLNLLLMSVLLWRSIRFARRTGEVAV